MNASLAAMLQYNKWANGVLFDACSALGDAQLDHRLEACSGSARELLVHIVGGQQTLVLRTMGRQHEGELHRGSPWPGFGVLLELAERSNDELIAIAAALDVDREVDLPFAGKNYRYPVSFFLVHAVEHGAEHRTEVKITLASLGVDTPDLDGWSWAAAAGYGRQV